MVQSQISRTLQNDVAISRIAAILAQEKFASRSAFGRRVCEDFAFYSAAGRPQLAGCMKALATLSDRVPDIVLPPPRAPAVNNRPRQLDCDVPAPVGVADLHVQLIDRSPDRAVWNTLIGREHPHGMTTFAGCQLRYLVGSAHGWLGAAGFSAAALRVAARDRWIGWDDAGRRGHLHRVICLSRFLIRPAVRIPHFASHVLGRILRRVPHDFEARYAYRPYVVESFAESLISPARARRRFCDLLGRQQALRITRYRETLKTGEVSNKTVYGLTSLGADNA